MKGRIKSMVLSEMTIPSRRGLITLRQRVRDVRYHLPLYPDESLIVQRASLRLPRSFLFVYGSAFNVTKNVLGCRCRLTAVRVTCHIVIQDVKYDTRFPRQEIQETLPYPVAHLDIRASSRGKYLNTSHLIIIEREPQQPVTALALVGTVSWKTTYIFSAENRSLH